MTLQQIVLWRHAQSEDNAAGLLQGQRDSPLTKTGWEQARLAASALARFTPQVVVASDLQRAVNTARVFTETFSIPLRLDKRLREVNLGLLQGLAPNDVDEQWPGELTAWRADPTREPPEGESKVEAAARAAEVVAELEEEFDRTVLLCAHNGILSGLAAKLFGLPVEMWPRLKGNENCHWTVLARRPNRGPQWHLMAHNNGVTD